MTMHVILALAAVAIFGISTGYVQESTRQRRRDQAGPLPTFPPVFGPYSKESSVTRWTAAALVGADVEVAMSSRLAIVPQMRVHFIRRSDDPFEQVFECTQRIGIFGPRLLLEHLASADSPCAAARHAATS